MRLSIQKIRGVGIYLYVLLILLFASFFLHNEVDPSISYWIWVIPSLLFFAVNFDCLIYSILVPKSNYNFNLVLFGFCCIVLSVLRLDFSILLKYLSLVFVLLLILKSNFVISRRRLNVIFLVSILISHLLFLLGYSEYGVIPGGSQIGVESNLAWRVTVFPYLIEGAIFSYIIFLQNISNSKKNNFMMIIISLYFIVFSGNRTILFVTCVSLLVLFFDRIMNYKSEKFYKVFFYLVIFGFIALVGVTSIMALLIDYVDSPLIKNYLFRTESATAQELSDKFYRFWLWHQHILMAQENYYTGVGSFDFTSVDVRGGLAKEGTGSESFLTNIAANLGFFLLLFLLFVHNLLKTAVRLNNIKMYLMLLLFVITSLGYGSYVVPYNFVFILMFIKINEPIIKSSIGRTFNKNLTLERLIRFRN